MNFDIRYLTRYWYERAVTDNLNALRVKPATSATQRCDEFHVRVDPETRLHRHADYFGTEVIEFGIPDAHEALTIDVRARVVTAEAAAPPEGSWETLEAPAYRDAGAEYLLHTEQVPANGAFGEIHGGTRTRNPLTTLLLVSELIPDRFAYRPGATYVRSTTVDLLEGGAGVCQDFVHLGLMLLRQRGIAARYVSGYLFAAPADGGQDSVEVNTHAWLEALIPAAERDGPPVWVGVDPTNRGLAGERHVKIGHGRSYADVPPIKGVYRGTAGAQHDATVEMHRVDPATSPRV
jgi:transglutaminase-like putative cysteine protease